MTIRLGALRLPIWLLIVGQCGWSGRAAAQVPPGYGPPSSTGPGYAQPYAQPTGPAYAPGPAPSPGVPGFLPETVDPAFRDVPQGVSRQEASAEPRVVMAVYIEGNRETRAADIRRNIQTRPDREYDPQLEQEDVRRLYETRLFHRVEVVRQLVPGGIYLTFSVIERPMVQEVRFIGNRMISDKTLLRQCGVSVGESLNVYAVQDARRRVEEFYHDRGHPDTTVTVLEGDRSEDRRIVLLINEGHIQRIWDVRFEGNDPRLATDGRLKTVVQSKPGFLKYFFRGRVDRTQIDNDVERLTLYYRSLGYFQARVGREMEFDDSGQWLTLTFVINEGPRYVVRNVVVIGCNKFHVEDVRSYLELKDGDFFNQARMLRDRNALLDLYGSHGHIAADVKATPRFWEEPGQLDLVYQIEEGDVFRVGRINVHVAGDFPHTRKSVVLNRLSLQPGDIIDINEVRASERRLKSSQLFITNPAEGDPPRIVIRPLDLEDDARQARGGSTYRGQSPDGWPRERAVTVDVYVPPGYLR